MTEQNPAQTSLEFERPLIEMEEKLAELERFSSEKELDLSAEIERLKDALHQKTKEIFNGLTPWERVQVARHPERPETDDYVKLMFDHFIELHGDRHFKDDHSTLTGFATAGDERILLVGQRKGKNLEQRTAYNFGCPLPEGYRKALLKMKLAEKFRLPVVTFINTPGAHPGIEAEERGQFYAIAKNIMEMSTLRTPVIAIVIGEGGSGGALGIGVADRIAMLEHSYYSVISPEGCAAILWKDASKRSDAARALKLTARDLKGLGIVDDVVPEPLGGAHKDHQEMARNLKDFIIRTVKELKTVQIDTLVRQRAKKFRDMGVWGEG
jgi:acetyl-CoA carboxylase carboxyl transferase subunit alpha